MVRKVEQICDGGASIYFLFFTENNFTWISESVTWMMAWLYLAGSVSGSRHTVMADWREQSNLWCHPPVLVWTSSCSLFAFCCAVEEPEWKKSYIYTWSWDCNLPQTDTCIVLVFHMRFVWLRFDIYLHKMCKVVPKQSYPWHVHYSPAGCQWCNMAIIHTFLKFHYFTS